MLTLCLWYSSQGIDVVNVRIFWEKLVRWRSENSRPISGNVGEIEDEASAGRSSDVSTGELLIWMIDEQGTFVLLN